MARYDFKEDIIVGEEGELIVVKDLESLGGKFITDNKDSKFDLMMQMPVRNSKLIRETTYEVKTDVLCYPHSDTANMFIEFESRGKASGIEVSEAEWFVMYYKHMHEMWYIKTDRLKKILNDNEIRITEFAGDSGSNTKGYLLPRYQYKNKFKVRLIPRKWLD